MDNLSRFNVGEKYVFQKKITEKDAAKNYGSKKLNDLLATPGLVAMVIEASVELIDSKLSEGYISIGNEIGITHIHSTKVGESVTLEIVVDDIQNQNDVVFLKFHAYDEIGLIAKGVHVRSIVNKEIFFKISEKRMAKLKLT